MAVNDPAQTIGRNWLHARLFWRACPGWTALAMLITIAIAGSSTALMITTGQFLGTMAHVVRGGGGPGYESNAWQWFVLTAIVLVIGPLLTASMEWVSARASASYLVDVFDKLAEIGVHPRGIEHLDAPGLSGRLLAVVGAMRDWSFNFGVSSTWVVVAQRLGGVGAFVVLLPWRWWVPPLIAGSYLVLSRSFTSWVNGSFDKLLHTSASELRRASYIRGLLTGSQAGKEVRLFGLTPWLVEGYRLSWLAKMGELWRIRQRGLRPVYRACLLLVLAMGSGLAILAQDVGSGEVGVASVVTLIQAMLALRSFGVLGDPQRMLGQTTATVAELVRLREAVGLPGIGTAPTPAPATSRGGSPNAAAITLKDVTFTYPTRDKAALNNLSLHIPAGQSVAIVGLNGAGKSTLIKLICGLYRPDRGTVRVGGVDPAEDSSRLAVIFQNFTRYHLSLQDNIELTSTHDDSDHRRQRLERALADAGGTELLEHLKHGWDTVLSAKYAGGTDPSGGQWQRVALARALAAVSGGSGLLILDEPTSALDVRAEAALFDRFLRVTEGLTTIVVSHRLSTVRRVDRILMLDPDRGIVEDGSHDELTATGGHYADMFALQARRFVESVPER
jgi:ATP-binding cassette subfamily B protein